MTLTISLKEFLDYAQNYFTSLIESIISKVKDGKNIILNEETNDELNQNIVFSTPYPHPYKKDEKTNEMFDIYKIDKVNVKNLSNYIRYYLKDLDSIDNQEKLYLREKFIFDCIVKNLPLLKSFFVDFAKDKLKFRNLDETPYCVRDDTISLSRNDTTMSSRNSRSEYPGSNSNVVNFDNITHVKLCADCENLDKTSLSLNYAYLLVKFLHGMKNFTSFTFDLRLNFSRLFGLQSFTFTKFLNSLLKNIFVNIKSIEIFNYENQTSQNFGKSLGNYFSRDLKMYVPCSYNKETHEFQEKLNKILNNENTKLTFNDIVNKRNELYFFTMNKNLEPVYIKCFKQFKIFVNFDKNSLNLKKGLSVLKQISKNNVFKVHREILSFDNIKKININVKYGVFSFMLWLKKYFNNLNEITFNNDLIKFDVQGIPGFFKEFNLLAPLIKPKVLNINLLTINPHRISSLTEWFWDEDFADIIKTHWFMLNLNVSNVFYVKDFYSHYFEAVSAKYYQFNELFKNDDSFATSVKNALMEKMNPLFARTYDFVDENIKIVSAILKGTYLFPESGNVLSVLEYLYPPKQIMYLLCEMGSKDSIFIEYINCLRKINNAKQFIRLYSTLSHYTNNNIPLIYPDIKKLEAEKKNLLSFAWNYIRLYQSNFSQLLGSRNILNVYDVSEHPTLPKKSKISKE